MSQENESKTPVVNRRYFDKLLERHKMSMRSLGKATGKSHVQWSLAFSGSRRFSLEDVAKLSQLFGEPVSRIIENAGVSVRPSAGRRINVVGSVIGDGTIKATPAEQPERTSAPDGLPENVIAVHCRTVDSPLAWMDGWLFFCSEPMDVNDEALGRFCYGKIKDGPRFVASIRRGYLSGTYNLSGPFARDNVVLEWASPILMTRN